MVDEIPSLMGKYRNRVILLRLRSNKTIQGTLENFDIHMNMSLKDARDVSDGAEMLGDILLRGDNILAISFPE